MRAPLAPPRLSEPRKVDADAQAVETISDTERPEASDLALEGGDVLCIDQFVIDGRDRVLPDELFRWNLRAEIARARTHIAVGQLEPRPGERICKLVWIFQEAP